MDYTKLKGCHPGGDPVGLKGPDGMNTLSSYQAGRDDMITIIKAEIKRISSRAMNEEGQDICEYLLSFLSTLESENTYDTQQYTPRPSVGIEDVARVQFASHAKVFDKKRKAVFDWNQFKEVAGIFYGFGKKDSLESEKPKPISTEDMPYITDEHFYEREPADSFKYKLAEYMTKCCTKKEGPYGYTYGISAESILKMAEEELLKRGVVQKTAEWSEEDEKMWERLITRLNWITHNTRTDGTSPNITFFDEIDWLKSLRPCPSWKPSKEQIQALSDALEFMPDYFKPKCTIESLRKQLERLI